MDPGPCNVLCEFNLTLCQPTVMYSGIFTLTPSDTMSQIRNPLLDISAHKVD